MKNLRELSIVGAIVGLLLATGLIGWYGIDRVSAAVLSVGPVAFALFCAWQVATLVILGIAWYIIAPTKSGSDAFVYVWGRAVREAAANCLPFSQVGGFVLGARAVTLHGISWPIAATSTVVDLTLEFLAEIVFALAGLLILLARLPDSFVTMPLTLLAAAVVSVGIWLARPKEGIASLIARLGRRVAGMFFDDSHGRVAELSVKLTGMYSRTGRVWLGVGAHLVGWIAKGIGGWIGYRLLGVPIDLPAALAIEGLLYALLAGAFLVPGYAGVQEGLYVGLGALFGVPPEISLALSLLRRARDITIGIPILLGWQAFELKRWRTPPRL